MKALCAVCLLCSGLAAAQERPPISTDRPGFSDGSSVVGKGVKQLEVGFYWSNVGGDSSSTLPDLVFRYGWTDEFELRIVGVTYGFFPAETRDWLDPAVGFKYRLQRPSGRRGELTFEAQSTVKTSDSPLRANEWNPTYKLLASTPVGEDSLGANLVWSRNGSGASRYDQWGLAGTYTHNLNARSNLTLELWGVDHVSAGESNGYFGSLAYAFLPNNDTQWDIRLGSGFNFNRDGWFIQGGYSVRF